MRTLTEDIASFFSRVTFGHPDECWPWHGSTAKNGYGQARFLGRTEYSHRIAFFIKNGYFPKRPKEVRHTCDVRRCCNGGHLIEGTRKQNVDDCISRGRYNCGRGDRSGRAKLNSAIIGELRSKPLKFGDTARLARIYGVTHGTMSRALRGETWK